LIRSAVRPRLCTNRYWWWQQQRTICKHDNSDTHTDW